MFPLATLLLCLPPTFLAEDEVRKMDYTSRLNKELYGGGTIVSKWDASINVKEHAVAATSEGNRQFRVWNSPSLWFVRVVVM